MSVLVHEQRVITRNALAYVRVVTWRMSSLFVGVEDSGVGSLCLPQDYSTQGQMHKAFSS